MDEKIRNGLCTTSKARLEVGRKKRKLYAARLRVVPAMWREYGDRQHCTPSAAALILLVSSWTSALLAHARHPDRFPTLSNTWIASEK
jgi:hypothetical protein